MYKVAHIIDSGGMFGAEKVLLNLMKECTTLGWECTLFSIGDVGVPEKEIERVARDEGLNVQEIRFKNGLNFKGALSLLERIKNGGYSLIHLHGYKGNILFGFLGKRNRNIPTVTTIHGWTASCPINKMYLYEILDVISLRFIDSVVSVSEKMLHSSLMKMIGVTPTVIPNGHQLNKTIENNYQIMQLKKIIHPDAFNVLFIGRLSQEKGVDLLLRAFAILMRKNYKMHLLIAGEGAEKNFLKKLARELDIDNHVTFLGYVKEIDYLLDKSQLFVLPSKTEGLPMTILESMHMGTPILASAVGQIPSVLQRGKLGTLIETREELNLAKQIANIAENYDVVLNKAELAKKEVLNRYSINRMAKEYIEVYQKLLKK